MEVKMNTTNDYKNPGFVVVHIGAQAVSLDRNFDIQKG